MEQEEFWDVWSYREGWMGFKLLTRFFLLRKRRDALGGIHVSVKKSAEKLWELYSSADLVWGMHGVHFVSTQQGHKLHNNS